MKLMTHREYDMERTQVTQSPPLNQHPPGNGNGASGHDDHIDLNVPKPRPIWIVAAAVLAICALAALLVTGWIPRERNGKELNADAAEAANAPVAVNVTRPHRAPTVVKIDLPGSLRPWQEVSIFARTTGYLKKYNVDISNEIEAGKVMAEIDTPEVNEELSQAQAALLQAKAAVVRSAADRDLAKTTLQRFVAMKETQSVTPQQLDEKKSALDVAESQVQSANANVAAAEATVRRLTEMQRFATVIAPFSGVVTGRAYDVGSLISANPTNIDIKPMFKIAQNDILRAFVNVPQSAALQIKKGMEVQVTVRERPGKVFPGTVMGTTNYLDPTSRSLLTEVKVQNPREADGTFALLPGMYIQAGFTINRDTPPLVIPGPALINNASGMQVAVVNEGVVHFKKVDLGQDFGSEVEIVGGLNGDEQIIANPGERVVEGVAVSAAASPSDQGAPAASPTVKVSAVKP
jgi:RND family efflux transporter MFP subunit